MSKEAASPDLQAAAYWRNVARSGRSGITVAVTKVSEPAAVAKRKEKNHTRVLAGRKVRVLADIPARP